jgi:hypothetical protein
VAASVKQHLQQQQQQQACVYDLWRKSTWQHLLPVTSEPACPVSAMRWCGSRSQGTGIWKASYSWRGGRMPAQSTRPARPLCLPVCFRVNDQVRQRPVQVHVVSYTSPCYHAACLTRDTVIVPEVWPEQVAMPPVLGAAEQGGGVLEWQGISIQQEHVLHQQH